MTVQQRGERILVPGDHNVVKLFPLWDKGVEMVFWAERGLICWEDGRTDGGYGTLSWQEAAERVLGLSEMVIKSSEDRTWQTERLQLQQFICRMEALIKRAREQGSPFDNGESLNRIAERRKATVQPRPLDDIVVGENFPGGRAC